MDSIKDGFNLSFKGHVLIRDPATDEILLDKSTETSKHVKPFKSEIEPTEDDE